MVQRLMVVTLAWLLLASIASAQSPMPAKPDLRARISDSGHLRGGWYPWDPYQYRDYRRGVAILTGFDVEIERALARIMSVEIVFPEIAWEDHLAALAAGTADIAAGATASATVGGKYKLTTMKGPAPAPQAKGRLFTKHGPTWSHGLVSEVIGQDFSGEAPSQ